MAEADDGRGRAARIGFGASEGTGELGPRGVGRQQLAFGLSDTWAGLKNRGYEIFFGPLGMAHAIPGHNRPSAPVSPFLNVRTPTITTSSQAFIFGIPSKPRVGKKRSMLEF